MWEEIKDGPLFLTPHFPIVRVLIGIENAFFAYDKAIGIGSTPTAACAVSSWFAVSFIGNPGFRCGPVCCATDRFLGTHGLFVRGASRPVFNSAYPSAGMDGVTLANLTPRKACIPPFPIR